MFLTLFSNTYSVSLTASFQIFSLRGAGTLFCVALVCGLYGCLATRVATWTIRWINIVCSLPSSPSSTVFGYILCAKVRLFALNDCCKFVLPLFCRDTVYCSQFWIVNENVRRWLKGRFSTVASIIVELHSDWDFCLLGSALARKATISAWRSFHIGFVKLPPIAFGFLSIVALRSKGFRDSQKWTRLYGDVIVVRWTCLLFT